MCIRDSPSCGLSGWRRKLDCSLWVGVLEHVQSNLKYGGLSCAGAACNYGKRIGKAHFNGLELFFRQFYPAYQLSAANPAVDIRYIVRTLCREESDYVNRSLMFRYCRRVLINTG